MFVVALQIGTAYLVRDWGWWPLAAAIYVVSATANQNLFCAQHEISHFLAFRKPSYNKALALLANLPLVVPVCVKFREYHHDHHLFLVSGRARSGASEPACPPAYLPACLYWAQGCSSAQAPGRRARRQRGVHPGRVCVG